VAEQPIGWRKWLAPIIYLSSNWISRIGVVLVTLAGILWLFLLVPQLGHEDTNPYLGIALYMILPGVFFFGLALIPLGIWLAWKRYGPDAVLPSDIPAFDFRNPRLRRLLIFVGVTTLANVVIASHLSYSTVSYMDSTAFCGTTCHSVMAPEYSAYQNSPHSRVECTKCHIGPGASWFVKSKLSGAWQVIAVTTGHFERPVPAPVENLRPARDTCEGCHWPAKFAGNRLRVIPKYADDEKNSQTMSVLMMKIGGGNTFAGIHGTHMGPGVNIFYGHSDRARQAIPYVRLEKNGKTDAEFFAKDAKQDEVRNLPQRLMDCMDCHNRPTHAFELPERGMDRILSTQQASPDLPFLKKKGVELLRASYSSREEALAKIPEGLESYYSQTYPDVYKTRLNDVKAAAQAVRSVYDRNVFPNMNVMWGTYVNNVGHTDFPGCFRCHDDEHKATGDRAIKQECSTCHELLAMDEPSPKILTDLGYAQQSSTAPGGH
jgi:hypothetical protein